MFTGKFEKFDIEELESFFELYDNKTNQNPFFPLVLERHYNISHFDLTRAIQKTLCNEIALLKAEIADLKKKKKRDVFTPPTLQECIDYAKEKNMKNLDVLEYWESRETTGWCLKNGAKIKSWIADINKMNRKGYYDYANTKTATGTHKPNTDTARRNAGAIQEDNV